MQRRFLGSTGIEVSVLGLGSTKFGRNQAVKYPKAFALPSDRVVKNLLATARELGINLIDTAPAYGSSEERLGHVLKNQRSNWVIATKVGEEFEHGRSYFDFSPQHFRMSIERSLRRLQTDYLDIVLVHSNGEDQQLIAEHEVLTILQQCKKEGLIRAIGMSTKTVAGGLAALEQADCVMMTYHPEYLEETAVLEHAAKLNKGILIKKALASGHAAVLTTPQQLATRFNFILKNQAVSSLVVGTLNPQHLVVNAEAVNNF